MYPDDLLTLINEDRIIAGFAEITDLSAIEAEIYQRRQYCREVFMTAINNLYAKDIAHVVTDIVDEATDVGESHAPILIDDLVDSYEVWVQEFLNDEESNINIVLDKLREALGERRADTAIAPLVRQLISVMKNWDEVAQPIQVSAKSRGIRHEASYNLAIKVRGLAIDMYNEYRKIDFSQELTEALREIFSELGDIAERTAEDATTLDEMKKQRASLLGDASQQSAEWKREITYEVDVGLIFKDRLRISPNGIEWKGRRWPLDEITHVRWGGTSRSVNGIPTGTFYKIVFGNRSDSLQIDLRKQDTYANFIARLWKAVCVRIMFQYIDGLRYGKKYKFGSAVITDTGVELKRDSFFSSEHNFYRWNEIRTVSYDGNFCIAPATNTKFGVALSYQDEYNIHILEALIDLGIKNGG